MIKIHIKHYFVAARKLLLLKTMTFDDESQDTEQQGTAGNMTATEISATVHGVFKNMGFSKRAITFQMIPQKHGIIQTLVSKTGVPKRYVQTIAALRQIKVPLTECRPLLTSK